MSLITKDFEVGDSVKVVNKYITYSSPQFISRKIISVYQVTPGCDICLKNSQLCTYYLLESELELIATNQDVANQKQTCDCPISLIMNRGCQNQKHQRN